MRRGLTQSLKTAALALAVLTGAVGIRAQDAKATEPVGWGRAQDGLQVGLLPDGPLHEFHPGDVLPFSLHVRNVGPKPVDYSVKATDAPLLSLGAGNRLRLETGMGSAAPLHLAPGQEAVAPSGTYRVRIEAPGSAPPPVELSLAKRSAGPQDLAVALLPGRYTLECPMPLWIADKNDPNSATAHRARAGVLSFTVAAAPPPVAIAIVGPAVTAVPDAQWGGAVDGLQAGLSRGTAPPGEGPRSLTFTLYLRNVSDRPLAVSFPQVQEYDWSPMVTDAQGKTRPVRQTFFSGLRAMTQTGIRPGEILTIGHPRLRLQPGTAPATGNDPVPTLAAEPGRYQVTLVDSVRFVGLDSFDVVLVTGPVAFEMPTP